MIRNNQGYFIAIQVVVDAIVTGGCYLLAWFLKFRSGIFYWNPSYTLGQYAYALCFIVPAYLILNYLFHLYTPKQIQGFRIELVNILKANIVGLLSFILILYLVKLEDFSRSMLFIFFVLNVVLEVISRNLVHSVLRKMRKKGYNMKYLLLVGYSRAAEEFIKRVKANPQWGYVIRGILDDDTKRGIECEGVKVIGNIDDLQIILPQNQLDEIVITLGLNDYGRLEYIVGLCEKSGVHTAFIPDYNSIIPTNPYTEDLQGLPVINIRRVPLNDTFNWIIKRMIDLLLGTIALILSSPIMLFVVVGILVSDPGPIIYTQERVGLNNKNFKMYKFRSMVVQKTEDEKKGWTTKDDPRVTKLGKLIRKTSIDELPQIFNVLAGDMSLVGPRPERPQFVDKFKEEIPRYMIKHQVRPGMTGWAQVNGLRGDTSIRKRIEYDLYYIENWTVGFDFKIMFLTVFKGFVNKNAY